MSTLNNTFEEINRVISGVDTYIDFNTGYVDFQGLLYLDSNNNKIGVNNTNPEEAIDISGNMRVGGYVNQVVRDGGGPSTGKFPNSGDGGFYQDTDNGIVYFCFNETGNLIFNKFSNQSFDKLTNTFEEIDRVITGVNSFSLEFDVIDDALLDLNDLNTPFSVIDQEMFGLTGLQASYNMIDYAATGIDSLSLNFSQIENNLVKVESISSSPIEIDYTVSEFTSIQNSAQDIDAAVSGYAYVDQVISGVLNPTTGDFPENESQGIFINTNTSNIFNCYNDQGSLVYNLMNHNQFSTSILGVKDEFLGSSNNGSGLGDTNWSFVNLTGSGTAEDVFEGGRIGVLEISAGTDINDSSAIYYGGGLQQGSFDVDAITAIEFFSAEYLFKIDPNHEYWIGISETPSGSAPNENSFVGIRHSSGDSNFQFLSTGSLGGQTGSSTKPVDVNYHKLKITKESSNWGLSLDGEDEIELTQGIANFDGITFSLQAKSNDGTQAKVNIDAFSFYGLR